VNPLDFDAKAPPLLKLGLWLERNMSCHKRGDVCLIAAAEIR
jgi:hypothetical protein